MQSALVEGLPSQTSTGVGDSRRLRTLNRVFGTAEFFVLWVSGSQVISDLHFLPTSLVPPERLVHGIEVFMSMKDVNTVPLAEQYLAGLGRLSVFEVTTPTSWLLFGESTLLSRVQGPLPSV